MPHHYLQILICEIRVLAMVIFSQKPTAKTTWCVWLTKFLIISHTSFPSPTSYFFLWPNIFTNSVLTTYNLHFSLRAADYGWQISCLTWLMTQKEWDNSTNITFFWALMSLISFMVTSWWWQYQFYAESNGRMIDELWRIWRGGSLGLTWHHIPEDRNLQCHPSENLKSHDTASSQIQ